MENGFSLASLNNKQSTWADDRAFKCLLFRALSAKFVFSSLMKSPCRVERTRVCHTFSFPPSLLRPAGSWQGQQEARHQHHKEALRFNLPVRGRG